MDGTIDFGKPIITNVAESRLGTARTVRAEKQIHLLHFDVFFFHHSISLRTSVCTNRCDEIARFKAEWNVHPIIVDCWTIYLFILLVLLFGRVSLHIFASVVRNRAKNRHLHSTLHLYDKRRMVQLTTVERREYANPYNYVSSRANGHQ